jgi:hypothetical protein
MAGVGGFLLLGFRAKAGTEVEGIKSSSARAAPISFVRGITPPEEKTLHLGLGMNPLAKERFCYQKRQQCEA